MILIAFVANETHKWKDTDLIYDAVNFIGSVLLLVYAILLVSYPFIIFQAIWAGVSKKTRYFTSIGKNVLIFDF